jgi:molybdate transport system permease protein
MSPRRFRFQRAALWGIGTVLVAFLVVPVAALVLGTSPAEFVSGLSHPLVASALQLSLFTTSISLLVVVLLGTPLSWVLATARSRPFRIVEAAVHLPIVIPPAVAGVALLLAFGRRSPLGALIPGGESIAFSTTAVVFAEVFVSAPFFVQAAVSAFRRIDPRLLLVARSLGASPLRVFARVAVPVSAPGLVAGAALSWARSLGEFGATLMFAGNLERRTQTLPLAIYTALESDLRAATSLSVLLVLLALVVLIGVRALVGRQQDTQGSG